MATSAHSLAPLLGCNDAPSSSQKVLVEEILKEKQAKFEVFRNEISRLEFTLETLRKAHFDLAAEMAQYTIILAPVRQLPPEIIGEIFLYFKPAMHPYTDLRLPRRVELPWKLAHICRRWRSIALSFSQLWAVLDLGYPWHHRTLYTAPRLVSDADDDEKAFTELPPSRPLLHYNSEEAEGYETQVILDYIAECVQRSGNSLLSIRLWTRDCAVFPVLETLLLYSARWRELVLVDPSQMFLDHLSEYQGDLGGLCKISFQGTSRSTPIFPAPNLVDLTFVRFNFPSEGSYLIPWSRLTQYNELGCSWDGNRLSSYRQLTNLLVLRLRFDQLDDDFPELNSTVVFPNLRTACFHFSNNHASAIQVLQHFEMPVLEAFSIEHYHVSQFDICLPSSSSRLKVFRATVHYPYTMENDLHRVLEMFPHLTELSIDVPHLVTDMAIARLTSYKEVASDLGLLRLSNRSFHQWDTPCSVPAYASRI
ncbi:hypothetical protein MSAN_00546100 [Mycena sanguinolenta]|uniref:F-box domain-containing protein n=1 Tax=Mycena sanguinolenta TaxID=230812 RepID=A0A8H6Z6B5_9AGAR|nr:hypothetical protein MSAN_00546100 [Mycena sanguinolenta]